MTPSIKMRPLWVSLKLCGGSVISATLLAEIFFRANLTIYSQADNRVLAYSLEEWSDITGYSIKQVRTALGRLKKANIVYVYNKKHPYKGVLRALHIEVPAEVYDLYRGLTQGEYRFEGNTLHLLKNTPGSIIMNVAGLLAQSEESQECPLGGQTEMTASSTFTDTSGGAYACPPGTYLSIDNKKKSNKEIVPPNHGETTNSKKEIKKEEVDIADTLRAISTMPALIMALFSYYTNTTINMFQRCKQDLMQVMRVSCGYIIVS